MTKGIVAIFESPTQLVTTAKTLRATGIQKMDVLSPYPIHGMDQILNIPDSKLGFIVLGSGVSGAAGIFALQYWISTVDYPLVFSGKQPGAWLTFIPITIIFSIICMTMAVFIGMLALNRLPRFYDVIFNHPEFKSVSRDQFAIWVDHLDPLFDSAHIIDVCEKNGGKWVREISE